MSNAQAGLQFWTTVHSIPRLCLVKNTAQLLLCGSGLSFFVCEKISSCVKVLHNPVGSSSFVKSGSWCRCYLLVLFATVCFESVKDWPSHMRGTFGTSSAVCDWYVRPFFPVLSAAVIGMAEEHFSAVARHVHIPDPCRLIRTGEHQGNSSLPAMIMYNQLVLHFPCKFTLNRSRFVWLCFQWNPCSQTTVWIAAHVR